ncbi:maleylpyruvate isomerase family mycothiol-dependent enzyme [Rothia nasimurium]|uniref:maleylpyruvate isomerase family mycothiol-dependent enzyme n=1 Tax=Rothia nasimurium TaxID=85336 RepID=UPI001F278341|nr:maleylpyruvate isomerase family mycothiol-dependent enzyme [Rothia nasimurium]
MGTFHDLPLEERLTIAHRGTAFYTQQVQSFSDEELYRPTHLEGWERAHIVAHVAYNAAALCNLVEWAKTGVETPMYSSPEARGQEIDYGYTLPTAALRHLHTHTVARLNAAWNTMTDKDWAAQVRTAQGRTVAAEEMLWMRSREVWIHAVDLDGTATFGQIPEVILRTLLPEILTKWGAEGEEFTLVDTENGGSYGSGPTEIRGSLAGLARWATGRGVQGVDTDRTPPRWL